MDELKAAAEEHLSKSCKAEEVAAGQRIVAQLRPGSAEVIGAMGDDLGARGRATVVEGVEASDRGPAHAGAERSLQRGSSSCSPNVSQGWSRHQSTNRQPIAQSEAVEKAWG